MAITFPYLWNVWNKNYYCPLINETRVGVPLQKLTKSAMIDVINKILQRNNFISGLDHQKLPNRDWINNYSALIHKTAY